MEESLAYYRGFYDYFNDACLADNPYALTNSSRDWRCGWDDAQKLEHTLITNECYS